MSTVLVVDDEFDLLETVASILELEGYRVIVCESGARAIELMRREKPALVLLDIMMPGLDGFATLELIRAEAKWDGVAVVLMSAVRASIAQNGPRADGFLKKPFTLGELLERVEASVGKSTRRRDTA